MGKIAVTTCKKSAQVSPSSCQFDSTPATTDDLKRMNCQNSFGRFPHREPKPQKMMRPLRQSGSGNSPNSLLSCFVLYWTATVDGKYSPRLQCYCRIDFPPVNQVPSSGPGQSAFTVKTFIDGVQFTHNSVDANPTNALVRRLEGCMASPRQLTLHFPQP